MEFLKKYGRSPADIDPVEFAPRMFDDMLRGLAGEPSDHGQYPDLPEK